MSNVQKPKSLQKGDTVGLICPGSPIESELIESATTYLKQRGYQYKLGNSLTKSYLCDLSGTDEERLADLNNMIRDPQIDAIFTLRGGYGANRILHGIDYHALAQSPKWFTGYSDITSLHLAIFNKTGLITLHGPAFGYRFGQKGLNAFMEDSWWNLLHGQTAPGSFPIMKRDEWKTFTNLETWVEGKAQGHLIGGNLSRLASLAGTPYAIPQDCDVILFLEEIDEEAYRVDRLLTQLRHSGAFSSVKGILIGQLYPPVDMKNNTPYIINSLKDRLTDLGIPILAGVPIGHHEYNMPIAHGAWVELDAGQHHLRYLEKVTA